MYMAKAIAAFISLLGTALVSADGVIPASGSVHLVLAVILIVAGSITTYAIPNRTSVADSVLR